ncbi:MAG: hypothetical protein KJ718_02760 [Nanoarchaeota archaeon]|nr:hypothetical protein [Nanoarchaeota archaeon]MBU1051451.1 hypothetical protein [Nanoarchaeota archaeon]MBU1989010.1 hypothetical protein [Nanoarchaeota archaeon]
MKRKRVNVTVDARLLKKVRKKLDLFGGKLSTLFNAYLNDFVKSMDSKFGEKHEEILAEIKELKKRVKKIEEKNN